MFLCVILRAVHTVVDVRSISRQALVNFAGCCWAELCVTSNDGICFLLFLCLKETLPSLLMDLHEGPGPGSVKRYQSSHALVFHSSRCVYGSQCSNHLGPGLNQL